MEANGRGGLKYLLLRPSPLGWLAVRIVSLPVLGAQTAASHRPEACLLSFQPDVLLVTESQVTWFIKGTVQISGTDTHKLL